MSNLTKPIIFHCKAKGYAGDKPHYWTEGENGFQHYHHPEPGKPVGRCKEVTCDDHRGPFHLTPQQLAGTLTGFTWTIKEETWSQLVCQVLEGSNDGVTIQIKFHHERKPSNFSSQASGHTSFTTEKGIRTFDRTGVEDSFTVYYHDDLASVQAKLNEQLNRVAASRERMKAMVNIPGMTFLTTPEGKAEIAAKLRSNKSHSFTPSGFGTGYRLYSGRQQSRYDNRAKPETEEFFGVSPIWMQQMDCD